jgi:hypothetical protein
VRAAGLAADPATGGYWIVKSDGRVDGRVDAFGAPSYGSLRGHLAAGVTVSGIAGE